MIFGTHLGNLKEAHGNIEDQIRQSISINWEQTFSVTLGDDETKEENKN